MDADEYQRLAMKTANPNAKNLFNACLGLAGEAGEVCDLVKKHTQQGHTLDVSKLEDEASDIAWYLALLATVLDIPLSQILRHNVDKLSSRYPKGFEPEKSTHRKEYVEAVAKEAEKE